MRTIAKVGTVVATTTLALGMALPAFADAPNGYFVSNSNAKSQGNCVGVLSSRIIQNGQFVGSGNNAYGYDQTTTPGSRAAAVHDAQAGTC